VAQAIPVIESQTLAQSQNGAAGAVVRGVTPADLKAMSIITGNINPARWPVSARATTGAT